MSGKFFLLLPPETPASIANWQAFPFFSPKLGNTGQNDIFAPLN